MQPTPAISKKTLTTTVWIPAGYVELEGELELPNYAACVVLFPHDSGGMGHDRYVAKSIREAGFGTLQFDLLTQKEKQQDAATSALRFEIDLLAQRLIGVASWLENQTAMHSLKMGFYGTRTGGAATLLAAAELGDRIAAVVARSGRPDLAGHVLHQVRSPTLLIVGGYDEMAICLSDEACAKLRCENDLRIIPCATHLFEEPGKMEQVAQLSTQWFSRHMVLTDEWKDAA